MGVFSDMMDDHSKEVIKLQKRIDELEKALQEVVDYAGHRIYGDDLKRYKELLNKPS